jgi:hypothetical protein
MILFPVTERWDIYAGEMIQRVPACVVLDYFESTVKHPELVDLDELPAIEWINANMDVLAYEADLARRAES